LEFNVPFQHKYGYIRDETTLSHTSAYERCYSVVEILDEVVRILTPLAVVTHVSQLTVARPSVIHQCTCSGVHTRTCLARANYTHTHMKRPISSLDWVLSHWTHFTVPRFILCVHYFVCDCILHACMYSSMVRIDA